MKAIKTILLFATAFLLFSCKSALPSDEILRGYGWTLEFESLTDPQQSLVLTKEDFAFQRSGRGHYLYSNPNAEVEFIWSATKGGFAVSPSVVNRKEGYFIKSLTGPFVPVERRIEDYNLLLPCGFGERFTKTPEDSLNFNEEGFNGGRWERDESGYYEIRTGSAAPAVPSLNMSMQWCAFAGKEDGLYLVSEDPEFSFKRFLIRYYPDEHLYRFGLCNYVSLFPGESWEVPSAQVCEYKGDWHVAADRYREWYDSVKKTTETPAWLKKSTGWLLTILKQQNDEIIWPYTDLSLAADVARARGLDIVGLFGWTVGGHDRFYPEYDICPQMGGEQALREGLKAIHDRGMHAIIYVNGQLQDTTGTKEWWDNTGRRITVREKDGSLDFEKWHKYYNAPARIHGRPCHKTGEWHEKMLELANMAHDLGADGIIFDQLGIREPVYCYADNHGHRTPSIVYEHDRQDNLEYVRNEMSKTDPEFIVMTEGVMDSELSAVDIFHGCSYGTYVPDQAFWDASLRGETTFDPFPEMMKYTHPSIECTVRHPTPVANRMLLNYGLAYGFKHEIETRYYPDKRYLLEDRIPSLEDYSSVTTKPDIKMMETEDAVLMREYSKGILDLKRKYSDCLLEGTFKDDIGVILEAPTSVIAKAFVSNDGGRAVVVVWNSSAGLEADYAVSYNGFRQVLTESIEETDPGHLLPQAVQIVFFEKK